MAPILVLALAEGRVGRCSQASVEVRRLGMQSFGLKLARLRLILSVKCQGAGLRVACLRDVPKGSKQVSSRFQ